MTDQFSWSEAAKEIGDPFGTLAWLVAGFVPPGPARTAVLLIEGLCVFAAPFIFKYYLGVLAQGAQPEGSLERKDYDALRASLAGGNLAEWLYAKWLTAFLDWVVTSMREFVSKNMKSEQISQAQVMARKCQESHFKNCD
jgi:hypothetical protein